MCFLITVFILLISCILIKSFTEDFCESKNDCSKLSIRPKYLLYDVNEPEGFNLKRDVYIRMASLIKELSKEGDWHLVLPPWYNLYHWKSPESEIGLQNHLSWDNFFDIPSLQLFAAVVEYKDFINEFNFVPLDYAFALQNKFTDFSTVSEWKEGWSIEPCRSQTNFRYKKTNDIFSIDVLSYHNLTSKQLNCISFHGQVNLLKDVILNVKTASVLFHHAEVALHSNFGNALFWECRRSMRFAKHLVEIATEYRKSNLNSTDELDKTEQPFDWRLEKAGRKAIGGPYLAVHLRRRDFLWGRPNDTPTLKEASRLVKEKLIELKLNSVFVATDAPINEFQEFRSYLDDFKVFRYVPPSVIKKKIKDGGVAIVDQIICSHARYFIGSHESTFSFRIQEEREILGFKTKTTFNRFCGEDNRDCEQPTRWTIVY